MTLPVEVQQFLNDCSKPVRTAGATKQFTSKVFGNDWDLFVEQWAPRIYTFLMMALGEWGREPLPTILPLAEGFHAAGATASFQPSTGQICLCTSTAGKPGQILEKLTHEMTHAQLAQFPEGDAFYEEGQVDYAVWTFAHAPVWEPYGKQMIEAADFNILMRRERAMKSLSDWDRKRWAGGLHASLAYGPFIIHRLRYKKVEGDYTW